MQIDGLGSIGQMQYLAASAVRPAVAPTQTAQQQINAAIALLQQEEQHGGGGGGGRGHGAPKVLSALEDLAARASLRIEPRAKTPEERLAEITRLREQAAEAAERVAERPDAERDPGREQRGQQGSPSDQGRTG